MTPTRRQFIEQFGIALASLVVARCAPVLTPTSMLSESANIPHRERLQSCWLRLDWLEKQTRQDPDTGWQIHNELVVEHRTALDDLVAMNELDATVADQVQISFAAAVDQVYYWANPVILTCYTAPPENYTPEPGKAVGPILESYVRTSINQLVQQLSLLDEVTENSDLDPDTVTQIQTTLERDIAFLIISNEEINKDRQGNVVFLPISDKQAWALYNRLGPTVSDPYNLPTFDELELEASPEAIEAAHFLVELLLGETE